MFSISVLNRIWKAYTTVGKSFGTWFSPIITGLLLFILRVLVGICMELDKLFFRNIREQRIKNPQKICNLKNR